MPDLGVWVALGFTVGVALSFPADACESGTLTGVGVGARRVVAFAEVGDAVGKNEVIDCCLVFRGVRFDFLSELDGRGMVVEGRDG